MNSNEITAETRVNRMDGAYQTNSSETDLMDLTTQHWAAAAARKVLVGLLALFLSNE